MTATPPRVEDLPDVVLMPERDMDDDLCHVVCCDWRQIAVRGDRLYAYCGIDATDQETAPPGAAWTCPLCKELAERDTDWNPRTGRCAECPQTLWNPPTGGER